MQPPPKSGFQLLSSPLPRVQRSGLLPTDLPSAVLAVLIHNIIKIRINTQYSQAQAVLSDPDLACGCAAGAGCRVQTRQQAAGRVGETVLLGILVLP